MAIKSQRDFVAGLLFTAIGVGFALGMRAYTMGTPARMGPAYFPTILGVIMGILGLIITLQSFGKPCEDEKIGAIAWRPLLFIIGANLLFGICLRGLPAIGLPPLGLVLSIFVLIPVAAFASSEFQLREVLVLTAILIVGSYVTFVKLLDLPFQVWPAFITG